MMSTVETNFLFVRHGETDWNRAGRWQGHADVPLNGTGRRQAEAIAARLNRWQVTITTIVSSDLRRCRQTVAPISEKTGLQPVFDSVWRERDVGDFQGYSIAENQERYPELFAQAAASGDLTPPRGESFAALQKRAVGAFAALQTAVTPGAVVLVVTHGAFMRSLFAHIIGLPPGMMGGFATGGNTGLSEVRVKAGRATLTRMNDTSHLEGSIHLS